MSHSRLIAVGSSTVAVAALLMVVLAGAAQDDPTEAVKPVSVGMLDIALPSDTASAEAGSGQQVAALDRLSGRLTRGDDADELSIGRVEVEFGPENWAVTAGPIEDYDGDGRLEPLLDELGGLTGRSVTALVRLDDDGDEADLYVLNGLRYRDSAGAAPPWQGAQTVGSDVAGPQEVTELAARTIGPGSRVTELDPEADGQVAWEADVTDARGREHTVLLDAAGDVVDVSQDD